MIKADGSGELRVRTFGPSLVGSYIGYTYNDETSRNQGICPALSHTQLSSSEFTMFYYRIIADGQGLMWGSTAYWDALGNL